MKLRLVHYRFREDARTCGRAEDLFRARDKESSWSMERGTAQVEASTATYKSCLEPGLVRHGSLPRMNSRVSRMTRSKAAVELWR